MISQFDFLFRDHEVTIFIFGILVLQYNLISLNFVSFLPSLYPVTSHVWHGIWLEEIYGFSLFSQDRASQIIKVNIIATFDGHHLVKLCWTVLTLTLKGERFPCAWA